MNLPAPPDRRPLDIRLCELQTEVADLRRLLGLMAAATGVDLDRLATLDGLCHRGGRWPVTWAELEALGLDPRTGRGAA